MEYIGLLGLFGLIGLIGLVDRVDPSSNGGAIRLLGLLGFIGLGGFWFPSVGVFAAFGALGLHNNQKKRYARLAYFGWLGLFGPILTLQTSL